MLRAELAEFDGVWGPHPHSGSRRHIALRGADSNPAAPGGVVPSRSHSGGNGPYESVRAGSREFGVAVGVSQADSRRYAINPVKG